ncbi:response regulator transcription factor [Cognatishimia sp. SS12]|uniref:response regulator n=1 Tax=Cognatishimia sp. SS12 TaxID=2979465 RepID=UPI00232AAA1C|nr:response regulator transcription factor [Cognatishimia sp. SS12]MDC0739442.1 response regulator transcription factor [Cognatishimia sp. SS12]
MKILAVDDDELIREILSATLEAHGYTDVTLAESGEDALQKIAASPTPFEGFMFDIQMPGMDGTELCQHVRQMEAYRNTPVIMITAMNNKEYVDRAFMAGATDYVTKPFDTTELMTRIRLADRLQAEARKAQAAQAAAPAAAAAPKPPFATPVTVKDVRGVVKSAALDNYVLLMLEQKQFAMGAFAIRIPELEQVHAGSDIEEFTYVVTDVAEVISDVLVGAQAFLSYIGGGVFVCVGAKNKLPTADSMHDEFVMMLNDPDLVYCEEVATGFSAQIGEIAAPKLFEKRGDLRFLDRAVEKLNEVSSSTGQRSGNGRSAFAA